MVENKSVCPFMLIIACNEIKNIEDAKYHAECMGKECVMWRFEREDAPKAKIEKSDAGYCSLGAIGDNFHSVLKGIEELKNK